ncbi:MAG: hypothetical protein QM722_22720 [Piscinibacter sp.]
MRSRRCLLASCVLLLATGHALAFPDGSTAPSADEISKRLSDRVFRVKLANGTTWRLDFKSSGYVYVDTSTGFRNNGKWRTENGKLCSRMQGGDESCNEARLFEDTLHLRRLDGEIIRYVPQ